MTTSPKVSLVDRAYDLAKGRILSAQLLPDAVVDENSLAVELGASKTPVRQALLRLSTEGYIRILPQRGTLVNRIAVSDIHQVYLLRTLLEPAANEIAATKATPSQIAYLEDLDEVFQRSDERCPDLDTHSAIHVGIAALAGIPRLTKIISELQDQMHWFLSVRAAEGGPMPPRHRHTELIEAIKSGDPLQARTITEESISRSRTQVTAQMSADPDYDIFLTKRSPNS